MFPPAGTARLPWGRDYPDVFTGLGSVDPHKGEAAVAEVANIASLGLRGVKFHPSLQAFSPDDPQYWPVFAACQRHGLLALFHTGTSGIGARQPGGQGIRIDLAHPVKLDPVAAAHPLFTPERCLSELEVLDLPAEVCSAVLHDNAARILS